MCVILSVYYDILCVHIYHYLSSYFIYITILPLHAIVAAATTITTTTTTTNNNNNKII